MASTADFTYCPCPIVSGCKSTFTSTVTNVITPVMYSWDFGDCTPKSTEQNPCHTYCKPGTFTVKLTVSNGTSSTPDVVVSKCVVVVASFWSSFLSILLFLIVIALIVAIIWYFFFRKPKDACVAEETVVCAKLPSSSRARSSRR